jgi:hypothetical protein
MGRKRPTIPNRMKLQPAIKVRIRLVREVKTIGSDLKVTGVEVRRKIRIKQDLIFAVGQI